MQKGENQRQVFRQTQNALAVHILKHFLEAKPHERKEWGKLACELINFLFKEPHIFTLSLPSSRYSASKNKDHSHPFASLKLISSDIRKQLNNNSTFTICFFRKQTERFMKKMRIIAYKDNENPETYFSSITKLAEVNPTLFCRALAQAQSFYYQGNEKGFEHLTWWLISSASVEAIKLTNKQFSQLLYLNGHLNYLLNRIDEAQSKIQESKYKNERNTKARRCSLKISIRKGDFSGVIWQEKVLWQYSTTKIYQFQVVKNVAQFLTKGSQQVWEEITEIKEELQAFPDREKKYLDANFSLGFLHFLLSDDSTAFKYFAKDYQINKNDISLVRLMGLSRYKMNDYASAMDYFNRVRELRPDLTNDNELLMTMICCLKTASEDAAMQIMPQIEERANYPRNMKYTWPYSLYLGVLYHLREDLKAIQCYSRLECKYSSDFEIMQLKIVMILCHHRRGEGQKVMKLLEEIQAIQAKLQLHKIPINQHYIHSKQLIFLVNYCQTNKLNQLQLNFSQSIGKLIDYTNKTYGIPSMIEPLIQRKDDFEIQFACQ